MWHIGIGRCKLGFLHMIIIEIMLHIYNVTCPLKSLTIIFQHLFYFILPIINPYLLVECANVVLECYIMYTFKCFLSFTLKKKKYMIKCNFFLFNFKVK